MRRFYMAVICVFAAAVIIFAAQNLEMVAMSFLGSQRPGAARALAAGVYLRGAVTGSSLLALLRQTIEGATRHKGAKP